MITSAVFLVFGGLFILKLMTGIMQLLGYQWQNDGKDKYRIMKIFSVPLISAAILMTFAIWGIPLLQANGMQ